MSKQAKALGLIAALIAIPIIGIAVTNAPSDSESEPEQWGTTVACFYGGGRAPTTTTWRTTEYAKAMAVQLSDDQVHCKIFKIGKDVPYGYTVSGIDGQLVKVK